MNWSETMLLINKKTFWRLKIIWAHKIRSNYLAIIWGKIIPLKLSKSSRAPLHLKRGLIKACFQSLGTIYGLIQSLKIKGSIGAKNGNTTWSLKVESSQCQQSPNDQGKSIDWIHYQYWLQKSWKTFEFFAK